MGGGFSASQVGASLNDAAATEIYTPKDFDITRIVRDIVELVGERNAVAAPV